MPVKIAALAGVLLSLAAGLLIFTMRDGSEASQQIEGPASPQIAAPGAFFATPEGAQAAPAEPFLNGNGAEVRLADFAGKTVVLNFWATWCTPCVKELPSLARLQAAGEIAPELGMEYCYMSLLSAVVGGLMGLCYAADHDRTVEDLMDNLRLMIRRTLGK